MVTPNWSFRLPGAEYSDADPHGYMPRDEVVCRFEHYAERFQLVQFAVFDAFGFPLTRSGVTQVAGLYIVGLLGLDTMKTRLSLGVGDNAARVAEHIEANRRSLPQHPSHR